MEYCKLRSDELYTTQYLCCLSARNAAATRKVLTRSCAKHTTAIYQMDHFKTVFCLLLPLQMLPLLNFKLRNTRYLFRKYRVDCQVMACRRIFDLYYNKIFDKINGNYVTSNFKGVTFFKKNIFCL